MFFFGFITTVYRIYKNIEKKKSPRLEIVIFYELGFKNRCGLLSPCSNTRRYYYYTGLTAIFTVIK